MRRHPSGFSLLEVIIAASLAAILLVSFFQLIATQSKVVSEEMQDTDAQTGLLRGLSNMLPLLQESRPTNFFSSNNSNSNRYLFRIPMKTVDGSPITHQSTKSGRTQFQFGAGELGFMTVGGYYEIFFQPGYDDLSGIGRLEEKLVESKLIGPSGATGLDLNEDGDTSDVFIFGTLVLRQYSADNTLVGERTLGGRVCVPADGPNIFDLKGLSLTVTLMYADIREKIGEVSRLRVTQSMVNLRNGRQVYPPDPLENY